MRRSFTVHKQLIGFAIFAMLMCFCGFMQRVQADNADLGGVNLSIIDIRIENDSFSLLSMFPSQNEPEPFIIQYGDETVTIPHKEEYNIKIRMGTIIAIRAMSWNPVGWMEKQSNW